MAPAMRCDTSTQAEEPQENDAPTRDAGSSNSSTNSPKSRTMSATIRKKPSLAQILTRVRPISGASTVSDDSVKTAKPAPNDSPKLSGNSISSILTSDSNSTKSRRGRELAPWDRTVDVVYHEYRKGAVRPDNSLVFQSSVNLFLREHGRQRRPVRKGYFALPAALRFRIWEYVIEVNSTDKPIALTLAHWNKDAWRQGEFTNLRHATRHLQSYFKVSFEFRTDALVYFLMTRRFHITYSPCILPRLNPIATMWVEKYGHYLQEIALEIVLTEYRFGINPLAHLLAPATTNLTNLIESFVCVQLKRRSFSTIKSLVVLCRRFYGGRRMSSRPQSPGIPGGIKVPC